MPSLRARFIENDVLIADTPVEQANISFRLNQSGEWSLNIPANIYAVQEIEEGNLVEIYEDQTLLISGTIQSLSDNTSDNKMTIDIKGRDRTDDLYAKRANTIGIYEDLPLLTILGDLLKRLDWRIGDISTMEDKTLVTTIDLRTQETLMSQVNKLLESQKNLWFRYGGIIADYPTIDVGEFQEESGVELYLPPDSSKIDLWEERQGAIISLSETQTFTDVIHSVEGFGGDVQDNTGVLRMISLRDAAVADPTLFSDPDFPIIEEISNRVYYIRNNDIAGDGGTIQVIGNLAAGTGQQIIGDSAGSEFAHAGSFIPIPGILKSFSILFSASAGAPTGDINWRLHLPDPGNSDRPGDVLMSGLFTPIASTLNKIDVVDGVYLDSGQMYWLSFTGVDNQALNVNYRLTTNTTTESLISSVCRSANQGVTWTVDLPTNTFHLTVVTEQTIEPQGTEIVKRYTQYAPERKNSNATLAAISAAGVALYDRLVAFLQDHRQVFKNYKVTAVGKNLIVKSGDNVYIHFTSARALQDNFTLNVEFIKKIISGNLRCLGQTLQYSDNKITWDFELTDGDAFGSEELFVSIYDNIKEKPQPSGAKPSFGFVPQIATISASASLAPPDTQMEDGRDAKLITFALPAAPASSTDVIRGGTPYVTASSSDMDVEFLTDPDFITATGVTCRVAPLGGWNVGSTISMETKIIWL